MGAWKTGYERLRNRTCDTAICEFGEGIMHKEVHPAETKKTKLRYIGNIGVYLGGMARSNESVVGTEQGLIKAFAVNRKPKKDRWDYQAITEMPGTLIRPNPEGSGNDRIAIRIEGRVER